MNRFGKIAVWLAGSLVLSVGLRADDDSPTTSNPTSDNPYAAIIARNIFGLNPPAPPPPPPNPADNLPKITPSGIMGVYGHYRVLFKVNAPPKPGQPAKDQFYNLSEGQRQDDIEIVKIDDKNKLVTFNNHGTVQELPLANTPATTGPSPTAAAASPIMPGALPRGVGNPGPAPAFGRLGGGRPGGFNGNAGRTPGSTAGANGANPGLNFQSVPTRVYQPEAPTMSPDEQKALIEVRRAVYKSQGDPKANLLPPTGAEE